MKILHLSSSIGPLSFGLGEVVVNLAQAQASLGNEVSVWCVKDERDRQGALASDRQVPGCSVRKFRSIGPRRLAWSPDMLKAADCDGGAFDVVHQHGLWTGISMASVSLKVKCKASVIVAPHGSLDAFVLRKSRLKKWFACALYERRNLHTATCLHALSEDEIGAFRSHGLTNPVALLENGVSQSWLANQGNAEAFRAAHKLSPAVRVLLFVSRIARKKGLPLLLRAWDSLRQERSDWVLAIVGGDEGGHLAECKALAEERRMCQTVIFAGPLFGERKRDAYAAAELFVLPSLSEGFPMVVLEALGAGVPAVVTKASPWEGLQGNGCGWWVDAEADALRSVLAEATALPPARLREMGERGKSLIRNRFTWNAIAKQSCEMYKWTTSLRPSGSGLVWRNGVVGLR